MLREMKEWDTATDEQDENRRENEWGRWMTETEVREGEGA